MPLGAFKSALLGSGGAGENIVLLATQTTTDDNTQYMVFNSLITSQYNEYVFGGYNCQPVTDNQTLYFQVNDSADVGGDYDVTLVTGTSYYIHQTEANNEPTLSGTGSGPTGAVGPPSVLGSVGGGASTHERSAWVLHVYGPASTVYKKMFLTADQAHYSGDATSSHVKTGYFDTTNSVADIRFWFASGNFRGTIKMWGVKS